MRYYVGENLRGRDGNGYPKTSFLEDQARDETPVFLLTCEQHGTRDFIRRRGRRAGWSSAAETVDGGWPPLSRRRVPPSPPRRPASTRSARNQRPFSVCPR